MQPEIYWIDSPWLGRLAIMPRPRGGEWLRDEIRTWKAAGLNTIICMLTPEETAELELGDEASICQELGLEYIAFSVPDREVPSSRAAAQKLLHDLARKLEAGRKIGIHCRMGLGRSAMFAASLLTLAGIDVETAFRNITAVRRYSVPDTAEQKNWVVQFAKGLQKAKV